MATAANQRVRQKRSRHFSEVSLIETLRRSFVQSQGTVEVGIGDDAAVVKTTDGRLVWSADCVVEKVHFRRDWQSFEDVGWRSVQTAVSDLAAMGAKPLAALSCWVVDPTLTDRELRKLSRGQKQASLFLNCPIVGGNIARGSELSVTTSVLGNAKRPLLRSGAQSGHELWLCGQVGMAAAGQRLLQAKRRHQTSAEKACIARFKRPVALIEQGLSLVGRASAMIDVSDGLIKDAGEISRASRVRLCIDEARLRAALPDELVATAKQLRIDPLDLALYGGDDYALLATGPRPRRPRKAKLLGWVEAGRGVFLVRPGKRQRLSGGYDHLQR